MSSRNLGTVTLLFFASLGSPFAAAARQAPAAGGVQASGPIFRVVRSVAGSKGSVQGGRFIMDDPRTIFYIPQDKQVIVYFEWEGPMGPHKFEGYWKNPDGKTAAISDFSFEARDKRFGGYWSLTLSETMQTGLWTLEARVDGEVTGTFTFQILAAEKPASAAASLRELSSAELYKLAGTTTVFIDRLDRRGQRFGRASGFFLGESLLATAFQAIDGASTLRITLANGKQAECNAVLAWNRRQDWAVLEVVAPGAPHLMRAENDSGSVGERVFLLDAPSEGGRTLTEGEIIGVQDYTDAGRRLALSEPAFAAAVGGPLLDTYGRVVGVLGGALVPGSSTLRGVRFAYSASTMRFPVLSGKVTGVPIGLVSITPPRRATLAQMAADGQFTFPLTQNQEVISGEFCKHVDRKMQPTRCVDQTNDFQRRDGELYAYVTWAPKTKRKAQVFYEMYDLENHRLVQSPSEKVALEPDRIRPMDWKIPVANLAAGIYRVDVLLDGEPAWRNFFRITE